MKEIYQLLSGSMNQELRMNLVANNLANINTPGFKRDDAMFQNVLNATLAANGGTAAAGTGANYAGQASSTLASTYVDFHPGELHPTGNPMDVAIDGDGFFTVRGPNNETFYTRAGNFKINDKTELVTASGRQVLDRNQQPIKVDLNQGKPVFLPDGTIYAGKTQVAQLGLVQFANQDKLVKYGEGALFSAPAGLTPQPLTKPALHQEALESSNVNAVDEMVRMIQTERAYQIQEKIIQTVDDMTSRRLDAARG